MAIRLELEITVDDKGAVTAVKRVTDATDELGKTSKKTGEELKKVGTTGQQAMGQMTDAIKTAVTAWLTYEVAMRGARAATDFLKTSIEGAMLEARQFRQLSTTMTDLHINAAAGTKTIEAYTDKLQAMGMADDEIRAAILRALPVTKDLDKAIQAVTVAYVAARNRGADFNEALEVQLNLHAGFARGAQLAKTLGITLDETLPPALRFKDALNRINKELGDLSVATVDAETQLKAIGQIWGETHDAVGKQYLELLNGILVQFKIAPSAIGEMGGAITTTLIPPLFALKAALTSANQLLEIYNTLTGKGMGVKGPGAGGNALAGALPGMDAIVAAALAVPGALEPSAVAIRSVGAAAKEAAPAILEFFSGYDKLKGPLFEAPQVQQNMFVAPMLLGTGAPTGGESQAVQDARDEAMAILDVRTQAEIEYQSKKAAIAILDVATEGMTDAQRLANHQLYLDAKKQLDASYAEQDRLRETQLTTMKLQMMSQILGSSASLVGSMWQGNIAAFRAMQLMQIAQAIINGFIAKGQIMASTPPAAWPALIAMEVALTALNVAGIAAQKPPQAPKGFEVGTPYVPMTGMALLHKGEQVIPANVASDPWRGGGGVTQHFDFSGLTVDSQERVNEIARRVAEVHERGYVN